MLYNKSINNSGLNYFINLLTSSLDKVFKASFSNYLKIVCLVIVSFILSFSVIVNQAFAEDTIIFGTVNVDVINDNSNNNEIYALEGNDTINGNGGDDIINAGSGNDKINGGSGDDELYADIGDDIIKAGSGNDLVVWGRTIDAGSGNDKVYVDSKIKYLKCGKGRDTVYVEKKSLIKSSKKKFKDCETFKVSRFLSVPSPPDRDEEGQYL